MKGRLHSAAARRSLSGNSSAPVSGQPQQDKTRPHKRPRSILWVEGLLVFAAVGQIAANYIRALPKPQFMMTWADFAHLALAQLLPEPVQGTKPLVLAVVVGGAFLGAMVLIWRGIGLGRRWLLALAVLSLPSLATIFGSVPAILTIVASVLVWLPKGAAWFRPKAARR